MIGDLQRETVYKLGAQYTRPTSSPSIRTPTALRMHNLPSPAFSGVAEYVVNVEIDAPLDSVWAILIDLHSYPLW